jgi:CDP-paratose 2-epimerase
MTRDPLFSANGSDSSRGNGEASGSAGRRSSGERVLVTGGAGFIGTNLAARLAEDGREVVVLDNLSRPGVERNLEWLRRCYGDRVRSVLADVRSAAAVRRAVAEADQVFHFAAQVAVTTSLGDPLDDFETNARGTLNVLEAIRAQPMPPPLVFTSTNKVYGALDDVQLEAGPTRYEPIDPELAAHGVGEERPLAFHSPYGCSKGAADQYVLDYARTFGLPAVVFRMSCIYGPHQHGTEDQGWVAHFLINARQGRPVTIYGDGKQVRDVLFVGDLVDAMLTAQRQMATISGRAFNMGGGPAHTTSLVELLQRLGTGSPHQLECRSAGWRAADQRYYVSDHRRFTAATGWQPRVPLAEGLRRLEAWLDGGGRKSVDVAWQAVS